MLTLYKVVKGKVVQESEIRDYDLSITLNEVGDNGK